MAKKIVRYLLEGDGSTPLFVENGGQFLIGEELVGLSIDEEKRHLPSTVQVLTKSQLVARALLCFKDGEGNFRTNPETESPYTEEFVNDMVDAWLAHVGVPDYV